MKIISLVPSITETLLDFNLTSQEVIGRTKFCIYPKNKVVDIEKIGGTKNIHIEKIKTLNPDLIIASKEENTQEQVEELMKNFNVWVTDIQNIDDNFKFISDVGTLLNEEKKAQIFNQKIKNILHQNQSYAKQKIAYLIWQNPYMSIGRDTFIHSILETLGFENIFKNHTRYPTITLQDMAAADFIFLSSEPYPFTEKHLLEMQKKILPHQKIIRVDGEAFSWYGTHLLQCENKFKKLLELI